MRVTVEGTAGPVLDVGQGEGVLLPLDPVERAAAFEALTGALAMLAGVTRPGATGGETDRCSRANPRSDRHRKSGVVVPLRSP